jgi:hypothetical protein
MRKKNWGGHLPELFNDLMLFQLESARSGPLRGRTDVRYWHLADMAVCTAHVCF